MKKAKLNPFVTNDCTPWEDMAELNGLKINSARPLYLPTVLYRPRELSYTSPYTGTTVWVYVREANGRDSFVDIGVYSYRQLSLEFFTRLVMQTPMKTIKELRAGSGLSQSRFAKALDIPLATIRSWENGTRTPADYVIKLIEYKIFGRWSAV